MSPERTQSSTLAQPSPQRQPRVRLAAALGAVTVAASLATGAWLAHRAHQERPRPDWNVIVVMADTLRADHLGAYGYPRDTSPWFDAFAREQAVLFEDASSQASCTFPSVNSFLTSRDPLQFVGSGGRFLGIPETLPTLASILRAAGYDTVGVSASPIVRNEPSKRNPEGGFGGGFRSFLEDCQWAKADCVTEAALEAVDELEPPFFLYLHYMDAHAPYRPPVPPGERRFAKREPEREFLRTGSVAPVERALYRDAEMPELTPRDAQHFVDLYDDAIVYMDSWWRRLEEELRGRNLWNRSIVVIAGDHGEELLEDEHIGHCRTLSQRLLHTPLAIRLPGATGGHRVSRMVRNLDVLPTLLDVLRIEPEGLTLEGESLLPLLRRSPAEGPVAPSFAWQAYQQSVRDQNHKLVLDNRTWETTLYALDGGLDVPIEDPEVTNRLLRVLRARNKANKKTREERLREGDAVIDRLRALGYLE